jgi:quercetin dioxygenase-like cupin family protein
MKRSEFIKGATAGLTTMILLPSFGKSASPPAVTPKIITNGEGEKINVLGDNMTFKLRGSDTNGKYVLIEQNNDPGVGIPLHVHENEDEIFKIVEGRVVFEIAGNRSVLEPGDVIFCPRNIPHTWRVVGNRTARVDLSFFPAGLEYMFDELGSLPPGPPDMAVVSEICGRYGITFL